ncbi:hypothetical protein PAMP_005304 [Pampus punctatissimus]
MIGSCDPFSVQQKVDLEKEAKLNILEAGVADPFSLSVFISQHCYSPPSLRCLKTELDLNENIHEGETSALTLDQGCLFTAAPWSTCNFNHKEESKS